MRISRHTSDEWHALSQRQASLFSRPFAMPRCVPHQSYFCGSIDPGLSTTNLANQHQSKVRTQRPRSVRMLRSPDRLLTNQDRPIDCRQTRIAAPNSVVAEVVRLRTALSRVRLRPTVIPAPIPASSLGCVVSRAKRFPVWSISFLADAVQQLFAFPIALFGDSHVDPAAAVSRRGVDVRTEFVLFEQLKRGC